MYPYSAIIIDKVAKESRSGMADAPTILEKPQRVRRWLQTRRQAALCEADLRDRSPQVARTASAC